MMPSKKQRISELGEKKLIKRLLKRSRNTIFKSTFFDEQTFNSLSDDAALINLGKNYLVVTTDLLTRQTHLPEEMSFHEIGKKTVTVNVSDLAAMGARPLGILVALSLPAGLTVPDFDALIEGILESCKKYEMSLIGGDINESEELTLCGTCIGIVEKDRVLMKSGAQEGDVVAVTGLLGLAAAGFEILFAGDLNDLNLEIKNRSMKHAIKPEAQIDKGLKLAQSGLVTSATDITDGLLSELDEMIKSNKSKVGFTIFEELLPIPPEVIDVSKITNKSPLELALNYGEDFELLVTVIKDKFEEIKDELGLYKIGYVTRSGQIHMVNKEGKTNILTPRGYEHFNK